MEATTRTIRNLIQRDTLLRIPYFQRRYVWGEVSDELWERFALSMESTLEELRPYFLGTIILKQEQVSQFETLNGISEKQLVIDGQQRLTTLAIYMKVLHMMTAQNENFKNQYLQSTDGNPPVIIHSCEDLPQFTKIMHLETPKAIEGNSNIVKAYNFFRNYLEQKRDSGLNLNNLLNTVNALVTFVCIKLDDRDDEQKIFDAINSLGEPLTTGELMKNFLYEANDEETYRNNWRPMFDTDDAKEFWDSDASASRQMKSKANTTIERFFHAFVRVKMWDFSGRLTDLQRKNFVKIENVFTTCKAFVEEFKMNKQDLAREILAYADLFKEFLNDGVLDRSTPQQVGIGRISCFINATRNYAVIPYILYILKNVEDKKEQNKIFGFLEIYLVRRMIVGASNNNYSDLFSENLIGQRIVTYEELREYIGQKDFGVSLSMPIDDALDMHLKARAFNENVARVIMYLYETKLRSNCNISFNSCFAEQFMPPPSTAAEKNWPPYTNPEDEHMRASSIRTLGNYFLLRCDEKEVKKVRNYGFNRKLPLLQEWSNDIRCSQQLQHNCHSWNVEDIRKRAQNLADRFKAIWAVPRD